MQEINVIFGVAVLIMSVVVHEVMHGYSAYVMGDPTAKYAGRLTLNPFKHLDLLGSVIFPLLTFLAGGIIFGWAKPVPYNPYNLKNQKWGPGLVAISGPLSNFFIAVFFGIFLRFSSSFGFFPVSFWEIVSLIVFINLVLCVFNMVPIPPLDGSKVLFSFLPYKWSRAQEIMESYGFVFLIIFILAFFKYLLPIISLLFRIITGA